MVTQILFCVLVLLVALQRLWEVTLSRRHERELLSKGAVEHAPQQMPWMVALHAAWLIAMLLEVFWFGRGFHVYVAAPALLVLTLGQGVRLWAIRTLGLRWTVKILTLPQEPPVTGGPFRYLRHPNYLGVMLEIAALPLVHGAWMTAVVFSAANALLLSRRIRAEERALSEGTNYAQHFRHHSRLVPLK